ncbi:MAG: CoA pyrophosphatase [Rhodospirillales bacterium]|jgi:8-oxo-dGTP pyrophosphatase MutT (NUDIX family)|nr:CoA pyrophosphatase [Rhodospirillales bacterium]
MPAADVTAMAKPLTRSVVERGLATRRLIPRHPDMAIDLRRDRGDHALNAGLEPLSPLKPAAVLVPIIERETLSVLFTRRTSHLAHHAGQISFPGGHIEPDDECPRDTALRETEEEIGLGREHVTVIGHLDTYVTRTGFVVTPVVGVITPPFSLNPDPHEVAEIFEVPLDFLMDSSNHQFCSAEFDGHVRHFYAMPYESYYIWGATAGMLKNFHDILNAARDLRQA